MKRVAIYIKDYVVLSRPMQQIADDNNVSISVVAENLKEYDLEKHIPDGTTMIITGGANGIDTLAEKYADKKHLSKLILRPQYKIYGRYAPLKRNEEMIELCDIVLVIWDGHSKGTKHTISYADKIGKRLILITEPTE